jgi:hypothetical protein
MVHSNNRPPGSYDLRNLPLETRIAVAIFDLCFEEYRQPLLS